MGKLHPDSQEHKLIILQLIEENQPIRLQGLYKTINTPENLAKLDLLKGVNKQNKSSLRPEAKTRINFLLKTLTKEESIIKTEENDEFVLTEQGKTRIIQQGTSLSQIKEKGKDSSNRNQENYITWTTPAFVPDNNRWEYYKQDQDGQTLEIYHNESEEVILEEHKEKVMSHILAAIKEENKEIKTTQDIKHQFKNKKETVIKGGEKTVVQFAKQEVLITIMRMKLDGSPTSEIITEVREQNPSLSLMTIGLYFSEVLTDIRERSKASIDKTIQDHLERYEWLFKWFRENGYSRAALKALERKEKLMGLHDNETVEVGLNDLLGKSLGVIKYKWGQLSESESYRLNELVRKTIIILDHKDKEENS